MIAIIIIVQPIRLFGMKNIPFLLNHRGFIVLILLAERFIFFQ